jgi:hypothetical protein
LHVADAMNPEIAVFCAGFAVVNAELVSSGVNA